MTDKLTVARLILDGEKFEVLVKPDPALEFKMGKIRHFRCTCIR